MRDAIRAIMDELGQHVYNKAYLTLLTSRGEASKWRLRRINGSLQFEYEEDAELFADTVMDAIHGGFLVMVLRSFTREKKGGKTVKELRAYRITWRGGLVIGKVPIDELITSMNVNTATGELMRPEPLVKYCIDEECISSDDVDERDVEIYMRNIRRWIH